MGRRQTDTGRNGELRSRRQQPTFGTPTLAVRRALVPEVLALVHNTYGLSGVARILLLVKGKYKLQNVSLGKQHANIVNWRCNIV